MSRYELLEKIRQSITFHNQDEWAAASEILDLVLPQVSTVEELEALPDGSVLVSEDGMVYTKGEAFKPGHAWWLEPGNEDSIATDILIAWNTAPLTVVWQP